MTDLSSKADYDAFGQHLDQLMSAVAQLDEWPESTP
jgi:hypothetical protein